jgi:hypothetical protein
MYTALQEGRIRRKVLRLTPTHHTFQKAVIFIEEVKYTI